MNTTTSGWRREVGLAFTALLLLTGLSYLYLYPGSAALLEGRTDTVMSDDTDPAPLPYVYDLVLETLKTHPSRLFYGTVYVEPPDPQQGFAMWMPWSERWSVIVASRFFKLEQLSTAVVVVMLLLNGLAMFALARYLGWNFWLALGSAIAWAFNPFTRARAKVHMAMAGIFHLPLIFLALFLIARGRTWRSVSAAAFCLVVACTTVHYFVVTSLFLAPFFLLFLAIQPETGADYRRVLRRLALGVLPAVLFLGFNFSVRVPPDAKINAAQSMPRSGETPDGGLHPYLTRFAAHPIDFLSGDIALQYPPADLNPLRRQINDYVLNHLDISNPHERTNGLRWSLLILAAIALANYKKSSNKSILLFFAGFGLFGFWLAMPPDWPLPHLGPSGWLYTLISQVRVPARAGIVLGFSVLMSAGIWVAERPRGSWLLWPALFPLLMLVDEPPLVQATPMAPMRPPLTELQRERGACGAGLYLPFVNAYQANGALYIFQQQMRGSDCLVLNSMVSPDQLQPVASAFPATGEFLDQLAQNLVASDQLVKLAACVPLDWIVFDSHTPPSWRDSVCARLGWQLGADLTCVSPQKGRPLQRLPAACL